MITNKTKLALICGLMMTIMLMCAGQALAADYFNTDSAASAGVVRVTCGDGGKTKVIISKDGKQYTYDINSSGNTETFPLQMGNGEYKISLLKNTTGDSYKVLGTTTANVALGDSKNVYLTSVQNIKWSTDSKAVAKAVALTSGTSDLQKKADILWQYMIKNNKYDTKKLAKLPSNYVPIADKTVTEKTGICYDFACLYAAMLRSQGTPAKLVKGYAPKNAVGYHAWNEVYDSSQGKWIVIDTTYDLQIYAKSSSKVSKSKNSSNYQKVYEY